MGNKFKQSIEQYRLFLNLYSITEHCYEIAEELSQRLRAFTGIRPSTNDMCLTTACIYLQVIPRSLLTSPVTAMHAHTKSCIYMHIDSTKNKRKIVSNKIDKCDVFNYLNNYLNISDKLNYLNLFFHIEYCIY